MPVALMLSLVIGFYPAILSLRAPWSIARMIRCVLPGAGGVADADFWGFGRRDAEYRLWYEKVAANHRRYGACGFVWDDAFGVAERDRFHYARITYALLGRWGSRAMSGASYGFLVAACLGVLATWLPPWWAAAVAVTIAGGPVAINGNTLLWKPEMLWFGPLLIAAYLGFSGAVLPGALTWSAIVVCNFAGPAIFVLCGGAALVAAAVETGGVADLFLGAAPGIAFTAYRMNLFRTRAPSRRIYGLLRSWSGRFERVLKVALSADPAQATSHGIAVLDDALTTLPLVAVCAAVAMETGAWWPAGLLALGCVAGYLVNCRFLLMDDEQCYDILFLCLGLALTSATGASWALLPLIVGAYRLRDPLHGCPAVEGLVPDIHRRLAAAGHVAAHQRWKVVLDKALARLERFPEIGAVARPRSQALFAFFDHLPPGSRVLLETHTAGATRGLPIPDGYPKTFWEWSDTVLPDRRVELVNEWNMFLHEREFSARHLLDVNVPALSAEGMADLCASVGASHLICFGGPTYRALMAAGWRSVATLDYAGGVDVAERSHLDLAVPVLVLLSTPGDGFGIVTPATEWTRNGNMLTMRVEAGVVYRVRYRHHRGFVARLNGARVAIGAYRPFDDVDLDFMTIAAPASGSLELRFGDGFRCGRSVLDVGNG